MMLAITEYDGELTGCCPAIYVPVWEYCIRHDSPEWDAPVVIHGPNGIERTPRNWFLAS